MGRVPRFEDMINQSPLRELIERMIKAAEMDEERLRIEIRGKSDGVTSTHQEHVFAIDPSVASPEGIMQTLMQLLSKSPGEGFSGEIRINFTTAGVAERYGSFTRTIRSHPPSHSISKST